MADTTAAPSVDGSGNADAPSGMFRSLTNFNARLYFSGLLLSTIGSWLQLTATSYLVYRLTGKASGLVLVRFARLGLLLVRACHSCRRFGLLHSGPNNLESPRLPTVALRIRVT